jgi:maleylacetoacetate isomerase
MKLYTYYRSEASFRVRIALNLKGIAREDSFLHLEKGDQFTAAYRATNPQMVVPTLIDGDTKLFQSLAVLEYLDEAYPEPPLLPADPLARAWGAGARIDQRGRLAPADRAACSALSHGHLEGQR